MAPTVYCPFCMLPAMVMTARPASTNVQVESQGARVTMTVSYRWRFTHECRELAPRDLSKRVEVSA